MDINPDVILFVYQQDELHDYYNRRNTSDYIKKKKLITSVGFIIAFVENKITTLQLLVYQQKKRINENT